MDERCSDSSAFVTIRFRFQLPSGTLAQMERSESALHRVALEVSTSASDFASASTSLDIDRSTDIDTDIDLRAALAVEDDAAAWRARGVAPSLEWFFEMCPSLAALPTALDAAIECVLVGTDDTHPLDATARLAAAHALAERFPAIADEILAAAFDRGLDAREPAHLSQGAVIGGRWRLESRLGDGATADVFLAQDLVLSQPNAPFVVAIKRFDDAQGDSRLHALRELRALVAAPHSIACRALALHAPHGEAAFLVTEWTPSRAASSVDDFAAAAVALDALHGAGLSHGDLKAEHIRIRSDASAYFIDFGCASSLTESNRDGDLARLWHLVSHARSGSVLGTCAVRIGSRLTSSGCRALGQSALRLGAPRVRRAVRNWTAASAAIFSLSAGIGVLTARAFQTSAPRESSAAMLAPLISSGRLVNATLRADGSVESARCDLPELRARFGAGGEVRLEALRVLPDGGIEFIFPETADSPSHPAPSGN